jgi:hypothetical protein
MSAFLGELPRRLKEQSRQSNVIERIAGQALRDLPRPKPLSPITLARIAERIDEQGPDRPGRRRYGWVFVGAAFLLGLATTASAQHLDVIRRWVTRIAVPGPASGGHPASSRPVSKPRSITVPPLDLDRVAVPVLPSTGPEDARPAGDQTTPLARREPSRTRASSTVPPARPISEPPSAPRARSESEPPGLAAAPAPVRETQLALVDRRDLSRPAPASPPVPGKGLGSKQIPSFSPPLAVADVRSGPDPLARTVAPVDDGPAVVKASAMPAEVHQATGYLTQAIRALRVEHSPSTALLILDRHAREIEGNAFAHEALLLRVEAMLSQGRQDEVLRLLDGIPLTGAAASRSLLILRGQLRAAAGRCSEGVRDFDLVLAQTKQPSKPALRGRALCRKRLGDRDGARADVERYQREFPDDRAIEDLESL